MQSQQQVGEGLFALADDGEVVVRRVQHPGVVGRDLRAAEDDAHARPQPLQSPGDPEGALDVPEVAGETDHPRLAAGQLGGEGVVAERVGQRSGQHVDGVVVAQPAARRTA